VATHRVADLAGVHEKVEVVLGGMMTNIQLRSVQKSRSGLTRMAKLSFEDLSGTTPALLWPEEYAKMADLVKNDQIVFVKGTLERRRDPPELVISRIIRLDQGPDELARGVVVRLHKELHQSEHIERLLRVVRIHPGNLDLYLELLGLEQVRRAVFRAGSSLRVHYTDQLRCDLESAVGRGNVLIINQRGATTRLDTMLPSDTSPRPTAAMVPTEASGPDDDDEDGSADDLDEF
jgi:DNA polymerase-3 subunit alpha